MKPATSAPSRDILVEELNGALWAVVVEKGKIEAIDLDPQIEDVRWGSLYWAKVTRIDARLNAAFLDLDGEAVGLIQAQDVWLSDASGKWAKNATQKIGQVLRPGQMIVVQVKDARLTTDPLEDEDIPVEQKASKVSMDIALQGRFLIYTPLVRGHKVSSRIKDKAMRARLAEMMDVLDDTMAGCILRASAANCQTDMLIREGRALQGLWTALQEFERDEEPGLIWPGPDAVHRVLADQAASQIRNIEVSSMENFARVEEWAMEYAPDLVTKIISAQPPENVARMRRKQKQYEDLGLFDWHDLVDQMNTLFADYVIMEGGASLIIEETAVATTIDVNMGAGKSQAQVNQVAMREAARHLRLRNIGGVILIDPAGNLGTAQREALHKVFKDEIDKDPNTVTSYGFTKLGLLECTRARRTPSLLDKVRALQ